MGAPALPGRGRGCTRCRRRSSPPGARRSSGRSPSSSCRRGRRGRYSRPRPAAAREARPVRRPGGGEAEDGAAPQWLTLLERLAIAVPLRRRRRRDRSRGTSRGGSRARCSRSRTRPTRSRGQLRRARAGGPGGGEIGHLAERFSEMASRLAEAEELERHFLMSVSHELRTPLTAIKGHVDALRDGLVDDPELERGLARRRRGGGEPARAARRRRARPREARAHRFTVLTEEVDMGGSSSRRTPRSREEARRREIDYRRASGVGAGDRLRRRPGAPDDHQPALERVSLDAGRRPHRARAATANGTVSVDVADSGPGITPDERERIFRPFVPTTSAAPASACRSRASWRGRSAAGSSSTPTRARAATSAWYCRRDRFTTAAIGSPV